jgi:hypothetical protein
MSEDLLIAQCRDALQAALPYMEGATFSANYARQQVTEQIARCENALAAHKARPIITETLVAFTDERTGKRWEFASTAHLAEAFLKLQKPKFTEEELVKIALSSFVDGFEINKNTEEGIACAIRALRDARALVVER